MAQLAPKQLAQACARPGQPLVWDGQSWSPDDALRAAVETQGWMIRALLAALVDAGLDVPEELTEYLEE